MRRFRLLKRSDGRKMKAPGGGFSMVFPDEELVPDERADLTPAQVVERKLRQLTGPPPAAEPADAAESAETED